MVPRLLGKESYVEGFQVESVPRKVPRAIPIVVQRVVPRRLDKDVAKEGFEEVPVRRRRSIGPTVQGLTQARNCTMWLYIWDSWISPSIRYKDGYSSAAGSWVISKC